MRIPVLLLFLLIPLPMAFADDDEFGFSDTIDEWANQGNESVKEAVENTDLDGNPINVTDEEINDVSDSAFGTLSKGKDFFFSFHDLMESIIFAGSPIELDGTLVLLISAGMALIIILTMMKGMWKHIMIFGGILAILVVTFMILGTNPEF